MPDGSTVTSMRWPDPYKLVIRVCVTIGLVLPGTPEATTPEESPPPPSVTGRR